MKLYSYSKLVYSVFLFIMLTGTGVYADGIPSVINRQADAEKVLTKARGVLKDKLGMTFRSPISIKLVTGRELDKLAEGSPYKGGIVGIHTFDKGRHVIYMMQDRGKDQFYGTLCHELTHAWQRENCPSQSDTLREGLAVWVEYKAYVWDGAYTQAKKLNSGMADPIYGTGYRFIQKVEDQYGEENVLDYVKTLRDVPPIF